MPRRLPDLPDDEDMSTNRLVKLRGSLKSLELFLVITGLISVVGGGLFFLLVNELQNVALILTLMGSSFLLLAAISSFTVIRKAITGQRGRYATNALVIILVFITIVTLINIISYENFKRFDSTFTRHFTLSAQTTKILENLDEEIKATAFFIPTRADHATALQEADDLMFEFEHRSGRKFTYEFVDPETEPSKARQFNATQFPVIILESETSEKRVKIQLPPLSEQDLTSAVLIVTGERQKKIYFLSGHGEKDIADTTDSTTGYFFARRGLLADNYQVQELNLRKTGEIPDDTAVLIIAGPQKQLLTDERTELAQWLKNGGRALFLLDPSSPAGFAEMLEPWGIVMSDQTVVDLEQSVSGDPRTPLLQRSSYVHTTEITSLLDVTFFPQVAPVNVRDEYINDERKIPPWIKFYPLATSSLLSFSTKNPDSNSYGIDDIFGPHTIGLAVQALAPVDDESIAGQLSPDAPVTHIVVIGDSDFANNQYYSAYSNADFLLNSVNWLAEDYDLISVRPKLRVFRLLGFTNQEFDFVRYSSWFFIPIAVAFISIIAWWRRR
ncbi:hypothetical protein FIM02_00665 [SAR202 cluster bacterium AD-802-E10_MRT_200m]|nr:hypothetical protein [SAR202 cluster bacterium AD-802-E10_MRT_200m]